jgi:hypothetical protein
MANKFEKESDLTSKCTFKMYDKGKNELVNCKKKSVIMFGKDHVCRDHASTVLNNTKKPILCYPATMDTSSIKQFLKYIDGEY